MDENRIAILTDSTCDVPQALIDRYNISVIPHVVIWGNEQYRDRVDIQPEDFYKRLVTDPQRPTSSQAGIPDFTEAYEKAASRGAKEIIILTVSSAMSGAYQMAQKAARLVKIPVSVVDSKGPTMTLGWQVLAAARAVAAGLDVKGVLNAVDAVRKNMVQVVAMDTLEYLQKGGRIGNAVKWVGGLLQVKPLVSINHQTGLVEPVGLARTHKSLVEMLYSKFFDSLKSTENLHVAVLHGNVMQEAEALAGRIQKEFHPVELLVNITGPVLGINTGPGALALCGYSEG
ncbi:EDD domain protein, DegV family [Longilinea arvoryzae]|uniref:EDD domain protein, DegV family n=1 Tax=Longilinea arvoryzae TaxID=360412 RepID=A0A0S7BH29_9CHLR|nr:DegV family protein [Longilinea arvoryzae]GAP13029.1 EDD domain protein, DegV family [Longilinea arvoryzae]